MARHSKVRAKAESQPETLKGWKQISEFLGEPTSVVQRWAAEGMPVAKEGRFVTTSPAQLNAWLGRESGKPLQVVTPEQDLTTQLKRGVAFARSNKKPSAK